jgi:hypothetical protein
MYVVLHRRGLEVNGVYVSLSGSVATFTDLGEPGNVFVVRPLSSNTSGVEFRDVALVMMIDDGTGAFGWRFDLEEQRIVPKKLDLDEVKRARCWVPVVGYAAVCVRYSPVGRRGAAGVNRSPRYVGVRASRRGLS